ncbi:MAG: hypothetical protein MI749_04155 [Desulfovibrionales bacterium]|nr:hypothetical protein [Desulfovibrionales bacterium]
MHNIISYPLALLLCCFLTLPAAAQTEDCIDYAAPIATAARLLAVSVTTTADALVALNKRANESEISSFDSFVADADKRARDLARTLDEKQRTIMEQAEKTTDYTLCKQDLSEALADLKKEMTKAKAMLIELKAAIKDILDQLKGAFFG